jgi:7-cyano-7-deazaguanine synthase in queuosine biosynthesis
MAGSNRTVFLMSGGLNSTTLLYDMMTFAKVEEARVLECMIFQTEETDNSFIGARVICDKLGIPTSLWDYSNEPVLSSYLEDVDTIVENLCELKEAHLFKTLISTAIHRAQVLGADTIAGGFCLEDSKSASENLVSYTLASANFMPDPEALTFEFPYLHYSKAGIFERARELNRLGEITRDTLSCDRDDDHTQHSWGYGCGECPGCYRREAGWAGYLKNLNGEK